jgi:hypothetical protein
MRVSFYQVFNVSPDGAVTPKTTVVVGGVTMTPGVTFRRGVSFSGVDIAEHIGKDLEVEYQGDTVILKDIYR